MFLCHILFLSDFSFSRSKKIYLVKSFLLAPIHDSFLKSVHEFISGTMLVTGGFLMWFIHIRLPFHCSLSHTVDNDVGMDISGFIVAIGVSNYQCLIWTADTLMYALSVCEDERLKLAINLSFSCSLRLGELLGLTWDCVDISPEAIEENRAYVFINKESQRIRKESLNALDGKDVLLVFPTNHKKNSTVRILKTPKTESSVRKIFLPKSVANMLVDWKAEQDEMKEILGDEYMDYNLVMASTFGLPLGDGAIRGPLKKLIEDYNLPPVVFHSFRHSSVTYKLKLNGGDIKAVQGDSGHAQVNMVTDVYSHILDDDRRKNAELFEEAFYEKKNLDPQMHVQQENNNATVADEVDPELLAKVLANPEMRALLNSLAKTMK